jgi:hypothetical protein
MHRSPSARTSDQSRVRCSRHRVGGIECVADRSILCGSLIRVARKECRLIRVAYARNALLRLYVEDRLLPFVESESTSSWVGQRYACANTCTRVGTHSSFFFCLIGLPRNRCAPVHTHTPRMPAFAAIEATLRARGDIISIAQWGRETRRTLSCARTPYNPANSDQPYRYALSRSLQSTVTSLLEWTLRVFTSSLAVEALQITRSCSRFIVYWCCAEDAQCCFSGVTSTYDNPLIQVCYCHVTACGKIERSLYYVMSYQFIVLINCFYQLSHICGFAVAEIQRLESIGVYEIDSSMESIRVSMNRCMLVLYQFVCKPICSLNT